MWFKFKWPMPGRRQFPHHPSNLCFMKNLVSIFQTAGRVSKRETYLNFQFISTSGRRSLFIGAGLFCVLGCWFGNPAALRAEVIAYPVPPGIEASTDYKVVAGNTNIFVYKTPVLSFASFALEGEAEVVLVVDRPIKRPVIRPLSLGIKPTVEGNTIRFRIRQPCHLVVEVDEDTKRPLFLFADAPELSTPPAGAPGVRYFPGGRIYEAGTIQLKDNETLYLGGGAVVRAVIRAKDVTGARILGPGVLDASVRQDKTKMVELNSCTNIEINGPIVLGSYGWTIVPEFSEDIHLRNLKVLSWRDNDDGIDIVSSRRVTVDHCIFRTKDDCIAVKALVDTGKSTVAVDNFEPVTPPLLTIGPSQSNVEGVRVVNSTFWSSFAGHALTVGYELRAASVHNILFQNCDIIKKEAGPALSIDNADFGVIDDVRFENLRVEDGCDKLMMLQVGFFKYSGDCPMEYARRNPDRKETRGGDWLQLVNEKRAHKRGVIRNVLFKNIQIAGDHLPGSVIQGWNSPTDVSNVVFENVTFNGTPLESASAAELKVKMAADVTFLK